MKRDIFDLDRVIYRFNDRENFSIRDAVTGVQIYGGIGSGKTSGSGANLARAYLKAGFGGLVLCAKPDVKEEWLRYADQTGRADSVVVFDASGKWRFPFLQYEATRAGEGGGYTENLVRLFMTVMETAERSKGGGGDAFWQRAMQQLLRNAIDLVLLSGTEVSLPVLYEVITSASLSLEQRFLEEWQQTSKCWQLMEQANSNKRDEWEDHDFDLTTSYWMEEFPALAPKTRSGVLAMVTSLMDMLLRRPFRMLFSSQPENPDHYLYPELTHHGLIIILDLPIKEFGDSGKIAQVLYKYVWQQAVERRDINQHPQPVFLWIDESQNFISEFDMQFQATARSSRCCTVYLTQNLPNYYAEMGGEHSKYRVDSLMGNMVTKIFHSNACPETNSFAADTIGRSWQLRKGSGFSTSGGTANLSESSHQSFDYDVTPQQFTKLRKGSPVNDYKVEGIIFQNGRIWSNGKTHLLTTFIQES
ncbi:MAG: hypothetical protein AAF734_04485 [Bacteroidota bacterium]